MRKVLTGIAALLVSASGALAGSVQIHSDSAHSTEGLGAYTGSISYEANLLTISLTNTSTYAGAKITGFVFNINDVNDNATAVFNDADNVSTVGFNESAYNQTGANPSASPYANFEFGAALGGRFLGGGSPNAGIEIGETGIFKFTIADDEALDVSHFYSQLSARNDHSTFMLVRFRGFDNGGSDKVPAMIETPPPAHAVPLPPAVAMTGTTMAAFYGLGLIRRFRRK